MLHQTEESPLLMPARVGCRSASDLLQVGAGAEGLGRSAVDDNHPHIRVSIEALQGGAERGRHVGVDRVVHVRAVQGQQADGTPALDEQGLGCWRGNGTGGEGHPASLAAGRGENRDPNG